MVRGGGLEGVELQVGAPLGGVAVFQLRDDGAGEDGGTWWTPETLWWENWEELNGNEGRTQE